MESKSLRAIEIDELVWFIRTADVLSARRALVNFFHRGERVSRDILREYQLLESSRA